MSHQTSVPECEFSPIVPNIKWCEELSSDFEYSTSHFMLERMFIKDFIELLKVLSWIYCKEIYDGCDLKFKYSYINIL